MDTLLSEAFREMSAHPVEYAAEVLQSALLLVLLVWAARRYVRGQLGTRHDRIAADLADTDVAVETADRLTKEAREAVERSRAEAEALVRAATDEAERGTVAAAAAIETEAGRIVAQAGRTVEEEKATVRREAAERLVQLTADTARRYLEEMLSDEERRALTRHAILAVLEEIGEPVTAGRQGA